MWNAECGERNGGGRSIPHVVFNIICGSDLLLAMDFTMTASRYSAFRVPRSAFPIHELRTHRARIGQPKRLLGCRRLARRSFTLAATHATPHKTYRPSTPATNTPPLGRGRNKTRSISGSASGRCDGQSSTRPTPFSRMACVAANVTIRRTSRRHSAEKIAAPGTPVRKLCPGYPKA